MSMTVNELYNEIGVKSPMKILSAYNGRVLCYNFNMVQRMWNTRAPILSAEEMEMLEGME